MVIAEALTKIKDLDKERREVQEKLDSDVFILPDLEVKPDSIETLIGQYQELSTQIAELKVKIIATNIATEVTFVDQKNAEVKLSIMGAIKLIETYRNLETRYSKILDQMQSKRSRFFAQGGFGSEQVVKLIPNFDNLAATGLQQEIRGLRDAIRRVEQAVIKANWSVALIA